MTVLVQIMVGERIRMGSLTVELLFGKLHIAFADGSVLFPFSSASTGLCANC